MDLRRTVCAGLCSALTLLFETTPSLAVVVPPSFVVESLTPSASWNTPTGAAFLPGGRLLVIEKRGRVYSVTNGVKSAQPLLNIETEVLNEHDRGLLGIAVDPGYVSNQYVYLLYTVDPDSNNVDTNDDAYGRLSRFQVSFVDSNLIPYSTRAVLMGVNWPNGPVSASPSHTIGDLQFGRDGSLFVSIGDGGQYGFADAGGTDWGAFGPGKTDPYEDIGAFRAQYLGSLAGKILRIDPANGQGYPSNPYYDGNPGSVRSRVWTYGVRNPFRICVRPGTGSTDPAAGDPGVLFFGDVGWAIWEEQDVLTSGGRNLGWPCYEGFNARSEYQDATPAHHGCTTLGTPPDNPATHSPPVMSTHHNVAGLSTPPGTIGNAAVGGCFYVGTVFPVIYRDQYFFADYGQNWIRVAQVDAAHQITGYLPFATAADGPVDLNLDPANGSLVYVAIAANQVRRIRYTAPVGNTAPTAVAGGTPLVGLAPLTVTFTSAGTVDVDLDPLTLTWVFGDGQGGSGAAPQHSYTAPGRYQAVLTADDGRGGIGRDTVVVVALGSTVFPTTPVRDDFNRADGPIAGAWVDQTGGLEISGNALVQTCCLPRTVWSGQSFGPEQEAYIRFLAVTPGATEQNLLLKVQGLSYSTGHIQIRWDDDLGRVRVETYTPGSGWAVLASLPASFGPGDQLGARAYSNGVVEIYKNGAQIGSASAADWPFIANGGRLGLTFNGALASRLDDFGGGDIVIDHNTSPTASILSPADGSFYVDDQNVSLTGAGSDAEQIAASLDYDWDVLLHHNTHTHPTYSGSGPSVAFTTQNHEDGSGVWYEIALRVTDSGGLADTARVSIHPEVDLEPSAVTWTPPWPLPEDEVTYGFWLRNRGRMPAPVTRWRLQLDAITVAEGDSAVPALDSVWVTRAVPPSLSSGTYVLRVTADTLGIVAETDEINNGLTEPFTIGSTVGVPAAPQAVALSSPRPNPSVGPVALWLTLPGTSRVVLRILDLQGRVVWTRTEQNLEAGRWKLDWPGYDANGLRAPSGVYLADVRVDGARHVRRIALLR